MFPKECNVMYIKHFYRSFLVYLITSFIIISFFALWRTNILEFSNVFEGTTLEKLEHISVRKTLLIALYISFLLAFFSSAIDVFILKSLLKKRTLGQVILVSAFTQLIVILFVIFNSSRFIIQLVFNANPRIQNSFFDVPDLIYIISLLLFSVAFARFITEIDRKLGKGNLWLVMTGRFFKPREEERIFMFLDLKASTTIAEKIGHYKFSLLIQDCFSDISVVERYEAEVYQYVGDEVVLTWKAKQDLKRSVF
jgi:adenylate cyclase